MEPTRNELECIRISSRIAMRELFQQIKPLEKLLTKLRTTHSEHYKRFAAADAKLAHVEVVHKGVRKEVNVDLFVAGLTHEQKVELMRTLKEV